MFPIAAQREGCPATAADDELISMLAASSTRGSANVVLLHSWSTGEPAGSTSPRFLAFSLRHLVMFNHKQRSLRVVTVAVVCGVFGDEKKTPDLRPAMCSLVD